LQDGPFLVVRRPVRRAIVGWHTECGYGLPKGLLGLAMGQSLCYSANSNVQRSIDGKEVQE
jgi:hypothetical protein